MKCEILDTGLSGCRVLLQNEVVIKSCESFYSERLMAQCKKQKSFSNLELRSIETPKVIDQGKNWFSMHHIRGLNFYSFLEKSSKKDLDFVCETLSDYFDFFENKSRPSNEMTRTKIINKLNDMRDKKVCCPLVKKLCEIQKTLNINRLPKSMCHGDLTLSNIIFGQHKLWLFDMLDTFIDSYILDLVKLKQDLYYNWSSKIQQKNTIRVQQAKRYIWCNLYESKKHLFNNEWFDFFDTLNIIRIKPYLKNTMHKNVFNEVITRTPYYENFDNPNGGEVH